MDRVKLCRGHRNESLEESATHKIAALSGCPEGLESKENLPVLKTDVPQSLSPLQMVI